jgi:hypothetical protein
MDSHLSGAYVTAYLLRPTLIQTRAAFCNTARSLLGLAPDGVYPATDVTISAVRSYRTFSPLPAGGIFSVALSVSSHFPGITWHLALWSPDFPLKKLSDCLAYFKNEYSKGITTFKSVYLSFLKPIRITRSC